MTCAKTATACVRNKGFTMKTKWPSRIPSPQLQARQKGFSLIEGLIAATIMSVGFLGLSLLQISLTRAAQDARAATLAAQVASETLENARSFTSFAEYAAIGDVDNQVRTVNGTSFTIDQAVTRHRFDPNPDGDRATFDGVFEEVALDEVFDERQPEFKQVEITVSWTNTQGQEKSVGVVDAISSATPQDGLSLAKEYNGERTNPQIRIRENTETGVIPIAVGEENGSGIASASSNPKPKQYAEGATGTTKFTVDTYLRDQANPLLQRKLDFAYASCVCRKGSPSTEANPAYEPTYWDGLRYVKPKQVIGKPTGVVDTGVDQDPQLCNTCCRDHHDALSASIKSDPFRTTSDYTSGRDHNHYKTGATVGSLALAGDTDSYLESCRMVRVDGVYQVATDTRLENFTLLRMSGTSDTNVSMPSTLSAAYADFAKKYVEAAYRAKTSPYPVGGLPNVLVSNGQPTSLAQEFELGASDTYNPKILDLNRDNKVGTVKDRIHYLNSRGIYMDWLSPKALERIACIGSEAPECALYKDMELLQMVPFVAVNLTQLSMWGTQNPNVATVRNDPIPLVSLNGNGGGGGNTAPFIRGKVTMLNDGEASILSRIGRSNSGLINTKAIDPEDSSERLESFEEYLTGDFQDWGPATFYVNILDNSGDRNFSSQNVSTRITAPVVAQPDCAVGTTNQTTNRRTCVLDETGEPMKLVFGNYNYYTCAPLGNKWVYDASTNQCVLPPANKTGTPQYGTPTVRDFQLCSVNLGTTGVSVSSVVTENAGTATETAYVLVTRNGFQSLRATLRNMTNPTFSATFATSCN